MAYRECENTKIYGDRKTMTREEKNVYRELKKKLPQEIRKLNKKYQFPPSAIDYEGDVVVFNSKDELSKSGVF